VAVCSDLYEQRQQYGALMAIPNPIVAIEAELKDIRSRIEHALLSIEQNDKNTKLLQEEIIPELQKSEAEYAAALDKLRG
jgi:deoxyadenosine/deoxycytidine kinase